MDVTVTNTGARTGTAVPQLYLGLPQAVKQPPRQLKGFQKVSFAPGESKRVSFPVTERALSYWDTAGDSWQVASGCYGVMVGSSSADIAARGTLAWRSTGCGAGAVTLAR